MFCHIAILYYVIVAVAASNSLQSNNYQLNANQNDKIVLSNIKNVTGDKLFLKAKEDGIYLNNRDRNVSQVDINLLDSYSSIEDCIKADDYLFENIDFDCIKNLKLDKALWKIDLELYYF